MAATKKVGSWVGAENRIEKNGQHLKALTKAAEKPDAGPLIVLPKLNLGETVIKLVGDSELIVHNWSVKAIREMLAKHMGLASAGKEKKDPTADFLSTLYTIKPGKVVGKFDPSLKDLTDDSHPNVHISGGTFGFPAVAFKSAAVAACTSLGKDITKVAARMAFHVMGELVVVNGTPRMRQDMVRLNGMSPDIRHRAGFKEWSVDLRVRYNARMMSLEQIVNLFRLAGFSVGVGEWRAEKDGGYGMFHPE